MTSYKIPLKGKLGIRSGVSKKMVFGICCDSKKECMNELRLHIGYYDSLKWRWHTSQWNNDDLVDYQKYLKEMKELREAQKEDFRYRKECAKYVNENKHRLKDEYLKRLDESAINIKVKKRNLEQWLSMPDRVKEIKG